MTALDLFADVVTALVFATCTSGVVLALVGIQALPGPLVRFWNWANATDQPGPGEPVWFVLAVFGGFGVFILVGESFNLTHVIERRDVVSAGVVAAQFVVEAAWTLYMGRLLLRARRERRMLTRGSERH